MGGTVDNGQRATFRFSVEGLPAREELLFKSVVRLLDRRTHQHWCYSPGNSSLMVLGEGYLSATGISSVPDAGVPVLRVGHSQQHHEFFLHLPIHANEVEVMLNKLGKRIARTVAPVPDPALSPAPFGDDQGFMLLRWPAASLLGSPGRIKLATLMRGRPSSATMLQKRSGATAQECADFLQDLKRAGLVRSLGGDSSALLSAAPAPVTSMVPEASKVSSGLLARIRSRLGLAI